MLPSQPSCHTLNFFYDDDGASALTILINGVRFHVIADPRKLDSVALETYNRLLEAVKKLDKEEADNDDGIRDDESAGGNDDFKEDNEDEADHANALNSQASHDSGVDVESQTSEEQDDADSAIDVKVQSQNRELKQLEVGSQGLVVGKRQQQSCAEKKLQNWMLSTLGEEVEKLAPEKDSKHTTSIHDWYHGNIFYYKLQMKNDEVCTVQIEEADDLKKRITDIVPKLPLPKYIRDLDISWISSKDIQVLSVSDDPQPLHPAQVKYKDTQYFFKAVDNTQPQPTKREIKLLDQIKTSGLTDKFNCPQVHGLVGFEDSKVEAMGFIMTHVEDPTPLTKLLGSDVSESKRKKWAKECERILDLLQDNKIVWGDAKADNFMVDKNDKLWIIDFGGSYTEGWVDPELMETKEGDRMGVGKIVNALRDPDGGTFDPNDPKGEGDELNDEDETAHHGVTEESHTKSDLR